MQNAKCNKVLARLVRNKVPDGNAIKNCKQFAIKCSLRSHAIKFCDAKHSLHSVTLRSQGNIIINILAESGYTRRLAYNSLDFNAYEQGEVL